MVVKMKSTLSYYSKAISQGKRGIKYTRLSEQALREDEEEIRLRKFKLKNREFLIERKIK